MTQICNDNIIPVLQKMHGQGDMGPNTVAKSHYADSVQNFLSLTVIPAACQNRDLMTIFYKAHPNLINYSFCATGSRIQGIAVRKPEDFHEITKYNCDETKVFCAVE